MSTLRLYGLKNCDTCKKALKTIEASGVDFSFTDIRTDADLTTKVPAWISAVGVAHLLNKRSTTWRGLSESEQRDALTGKAEELLIAKPTLIKRPVIEREDAIFVGWTKEIQRLLS